MNEGKKINPDYEGILMFPNAEYFEEIEFSRSKHSQVL